MNGSEEAGSGQYRFDPQTYLDMILAEVPVDVVAQQARPHPRPPQPNSATNGPRPWPGSDKKPEVSRYDRL